MDDAHFDAVIVGSGFGGSVTAYRLAEAGLRVCVLERGKAYPPGEFPRAPHRMKNNFWDPSEGLYGMYNIWSFDRLGAVVCSGLGGGSLIYANVLIRKRMSGGSSRRTSEMVGSSTGRSPAPTWTHTTTGSRKCSTRSNTRSIRSRTTRHPRRRS